ncbi:MAG: 3-deoxy-manno-octulosonate cytidylyltransferase [Abditibacteriales bacterium]|nr:3-deoxy-manno-octulosonate cytidylyltransferase [Abditibacteriales bacterium]MDW8367912.1 3-deoxy-manno-octulosonate cytidylyltransferase [Abditibacteriales bacterium]
MKVKTREEIRTIAAALRQQGKRIVFTNGCFDLLHVGHVRYLRAAKAQGDVLIVGLNSDASVRGLKGPQRPLIPQEQRAEVLAGLEAVDYVVIFDESTPHETIKAVVPHVHVKGGDYTEDQLPEAPLVRALGGRVVIVPVVEGWSTTAIAQRIQGLRGEGLGQGQPSILNPQPIVVGVIPARYASSRFPGKALADIAGKPMIQWVYERASQAECLQRLLVATDDERIAEAVRRFGGEVVMTSPEHPSGTDRLAEAVRDMPCDIVVNVQGDEPLIDPRAIEQAVQPLLNDAALQMSTLATPITAEEVWHDPNVVKVVTDVNGFALYFSRASIPYHRSGMPPLNALHHVGLYVYRKDFLLRFAALAPTPLEELERLEQLRVLESGGKIKVVVTDYTAIGVDTLEDLEKVRVRLGVPKSAPS